MASDRSSLGNNEEKAPSEFGSRFGFWGGPAGQPLKYLIFIVGMLTAGPSLAADYKTVSYPTLASNGVAPANISSALFKPGGNGPFPGVIVLHGCDGLSRHYVEWAKRLAGWGYVSIAPDSFASRNQGALCTDTAVVGVKERSHDVIGAAQYLNTLPFVQHGNIGVLGFSHGGWVMMYGIQDYGHWREFGLKAAVAYYPRCEATGQNHAVIKTLILMGDTDDWTPAALCKTMTQENAGTVTSVFYPGAYHAFNVEDFTRTRWAQGLAFGKVTAHRLEYDGSAARDSIERTHTFLDGILRREAGVPTR
jgi:dienelactone hydrolase